MSVVRVIIEDAIKVKPREKCRRREGKRKATGHP
jgi:hypothetical protein